MSSDFTRYLLNVNNLLSYRDKMENLVEKARKALLVNEGSLDPQGLEVHQEALVHQ